MRIGIDLGGTKIEICALNAEGQELLRKRVATPQDDYPATLAAISELVLAVEKELGRKATVGIGTPGNSNPVSGLITNSNSVWLNKKPLVKDLGHLLSRTIRQANDANCFALSEFVDGAAKGANSVFGVILGTGTGGGVVINGTCLVGSHGIAGEWGHNPLPWPETYELPGPACYCGKHGCIETFLSGPGLQSDHFNSFSEKLSPQQIVQQARGGNQRAKMSLDRYLKRFSKSIAHVINVLDPEVIVLGGGLSNIDELYQAAPDLVQEYVFSLEYTLDLRKAAHGDSSGVRGAALLWDANEQASRC